MDINRPRYIIVHTADYDGPYDTFEDLIRWHKERGFRTIGYHYYIRKDGTIYQGRQDTSVGAHCRAGGMNRRSIGICFEGDHDIEPWTEAQTDTFRLLATMLMARYPILSHRVLGHREVDDRKTCPGMMIDMDAVRTLVDDAQPESMEPMPVESMPIEPFNSFESLTL